MGGWQPKVLERRGWVLGDRGPLGDVGVERWDLPRGLGTDTVGGMGFRIWGQGCGFGFLCSPVQPRASHFVYVLFYIYHILSALSERQIIIFCLMR